MSEVLTRDLGILGVIFGICLFIIYKFIKIARGEAEIEERFECDRENIGWSFFKFLIF
jgi:hypothetical protein